MHTQENTITVSAKNLSKRFGAFTAVDDVTFDVQRGEIFGFLGANGAGKTTTIRMLCGLLVPTSGEGTVAGFDISRQSEQIKRVIGYMSQKFSLYNDLTVAENIEFFGGVYGLDNSQLEERGRTMLRKMHLEQWQHTLTRQLPLGWKQRLALGCAILHQPRILFLDEPTGGVDPISRREFWDLIYELADAGTTIFVTTHYMDEAEYCNRLSIMYQGKIIAIASPMELKARYGMKTVEDVFIHLVDR
ncbi:ABC transporter ATP-binding protein [candidate division KSB1 bacterium]|nr:ABC transporter ATP-binding protein [candidate division KSB1 bacterium]